jgi:NADPH:quinone reductase-like Zn-dependent oxidoreductase
MQAITVRDRDAGVGGLTLTDLPYPHAAENDVIVRVHAAGFTPGELEWPGTWTDRAGRDRTPSVPGHELSGVVVELGYGTTGLTVGQRVFGLTETGPATARWPNTPPLRHATSPLSPPTSTTPWPQHCRSRG